MIDNRKDILLLLLYSPGEDIEPNEPIIGRTRLVKMLFLFKKELLDQLRRDSAVTEENFYEFFAWDFGPFSTQVYDDLNFFILRGFIKSGEADSDPIPESAAEYHRWASTLESDNDDDSNEYQEEAYSLTPKGVEFVERNLYGELSDRNRQAIREFKKKLSRTPLRAILRYVYKQYPESTTHSKIKDQVLGDYVA